MPKTLSPAHWILLAISYASDSNLTALRTLFLAKSQVLKPELVLRILLTYLPESLEPDLYASFLEEVTQQEAGRDDQQVQIDRSAVEELSKQEAHARLGNLRLKPLRPRHVRSSADSIVRQAPDDLLVLFLIQRAHAIEKETGLLSLARDLVKLFLDRSAYLRIWYASSILPLLRFEHEYYQEEAPAIDLETFESFEGAAGVNVLMSRSTLASREGMANAESVGRDLRGTVGPWMYGSTQRKRRKLDNAVSAAGTRKTINLQIPQDAAQAPEEQKETEVEPADQLEDWQHTFRWMVTTAVDNFALSVKTLEGWRGPSDVDLDDMDATTLMARDDQINSQLHLQYCQAALAAIYAAESDNLDAVRGAHRILTQVAELMSYPPPIALDTDLSLLPSLEQQIGEPPQPLDDYPQRLFLFDELLKAQQQLTMPTMEAFSLLQMFVQSAYILTHLGFTGSIAQVAKLCFYGDEADSLRLVQNLLHQQLTTQSHSDSQWMQIRQQLLWLREWNDSQQNVASTDTTHGVFRRLPHGTLERELLKAMGATGHYSLISDIYLPQDASQGPLRPEDVEATLLSLFYDHYNAASNGNKTRGSMKKATDLLTTFQSSFATSPSFRQASALLSATHALSFYSLTLEAGKPTAPKSIKEQADPLSLIGIVLSQNPGSYTKLDDLITIARNLVVANPEAFANASTSPYANLDIDFPTNEHARIVHATRLVTGMAIEAALKEDDFETAYSYVLNRLSVNPGSASQRGEQNASQPEPADDTSWRAASNSGQHHSILPESAPVHDRTRRLEQRMDLLSRALSLAPPPHLPGILAAWRRCEEELLTLLQDEADAEAEADELADKGLSGGVRGSSDLPGGFEMEQPALIHGQQRRKEMGRASRADGEAPMGLFDVARGAAQAFGRMGQGGKQPTNVSQLQQHDIGDTEELEGEDRVRKRDMVANAVTGGMARGLGWVLGATPVNDQERG